MDKLRTLLLLALLTNSRVGVGQPQRPAPPPAPLISLTLAQCYELVQANYPLAAQLALQDQRVSNSVARLNRQRRLPQLALNAQATYQSEVTIIPLEMPGLQIPTLAKDQYKLTLDASQTLYDGGSSRQQQEVERQTGQLRRQQVEVELYRLRTQVSQLYFGVLLAAESSRLIETLQADLAQRRGTLLARRQHGTATGQDLARLDAEAVKLTQQLRDTQLSRDAQLTQLGQLLGQPLAPDVQLEASATASPQPRSEYRLYQAQRTQLAARQRLSDAQLAPRLSLFGQGGYGRPSLNFLRNEFRPWGLAGLRLSWNLSGYYTRPHDREALRLGLAEVEVQQAVFCQTQQRQRVRQQADLDRARTQLTTDDELIQLREQVQATAAVQLDHGIISFNDYFTEANQLIQARLNQQLHRLQQLQAQAELDTTTGAAEPAARP
jgi:outer membrane protein TolC